MCMTMTYQLWNWQYEWYISRGWWFVDSDEDLLNIHKYTCIFVFALLTPVDSSRAPCLTSGLQGSVNDHRGALLLVSQWQFFLYFTL